jgi:hypothetical protein
MPTDWSCNIYPKLHSNTGWTSVAFFESNGNMWGVNVGEGSEGSPGVGFAPVCALAH